MNSGARIGLAVGAGYLLGRRRKLRKALVLAAAVAAGRASKESGGLLAAGTRLLQSSPQLGNLGKLGGPLAAAGKAAATAAAGSGIDAVSGKLRGSADALRRRSAGDQGTEEEPAEGETDAEARDEDEQTDEVRAEGEQTDEGRPASAGAKRRRGR